MLLGPRSIEGDRRRGCSHSRHPRSARAIRAGRVQRDGVPREEGRLMRVAIAIAILALALPAALFAHQQPAPKRSVVTETPATMADFYGPVRYDMYGKEINPFQKTKTVKTVIGRRTWQDPAA